MLVLSTSLKASPSHGTSGSSSQRNPSWSEKKLDTAEKQAKIRDLLMSRSGVYHEAAGEHQEMVDARPERGSHAPGTYGGSFQNRLDSGAVFTIPDSAFIGWRS